MDAREAISLLSPGGIDPTKTYVVGGTALTPQDVAAAMASLCPTANYLLRAKYAGDSRSELWAAFFVKLMDKWGASGGMVEEVCTAAVDEVVGSNRCPTCRGTREAKLGSKVIVCGTCNGTGYQYREPVLPPPWDGRFTWCRKHLARIESEALAVVGAKIGA